MVRLGTTIIALGVALLSTQPAHADFVLGSANAGIVLNPPAQQDRQEPASQVFRTAQGFGDAVPLAFAVRQIVPAGVAVRYGAGVNTDTLVSWRGNRPWNQALAAAVRPIHLRTVTGSNTVLITR